jgi:hypothetical protein
VLPLIGPAIKGADLAKKIYWSMLMERSVPNVGALSAVRLAHQAGSAGYVYLAVPYARTDFLRCALVDRFMQLSSNPLDTLIMLDNDHDHPDNTLARLAAYDDYPVIGALAFRRGEPYDPCAFVRLEDGKLHAMAQWEPDRVYRVDVIGHAAVAIQRRVFLHLEAEGFKQPYWRYAYTDGTTNMPSEDMHFCLSCERAKVGQYVDCGLIAPHLTNGFITDQSWRAYLQDHPEMAGKPKEQSLAVAEA